MASTEPPGGSHPVNLHFNSLSWLADKWQVLFVRNLGEMTVDESLHRAFGALARVLALLVAVLAVDEVRVVRGVVIVAERLAGSGIVGLSAAICAGNMNSG